ncbi:hypothetical protein NEDG_00091 [Nematocida displodere]|uniref:Uncharacterized protein n=1 Tax=Nematocida displodere TaxID=1805483 RepID=A0A177EIR4_9MICR|nr:hypothetical protein NEDG_00091 [Nematocida displodere]
MNSPVSIDLAILRKLTSAFEYSQNTLLEVLAKIETSYASTSAALKDINTMDTLMVKGYIYDIVVAYLKGDLTSKLFYVKSCKVHSDLRNILKQIEKCLGTMCTMRTAEEYHNAEKILLAQKEKIVTEAIASLPDIVYKLCNVEAFVLEKKTNVSVL